MSVKQNNISIQNGTNVMSTAEVLSHLCGN